MGTADLPRMTEKQFSRAKKLLRHLCANYDRGNCLLLDDGYDPCPCPQLISNTLLCRYFRSAVLPADRELWAEIMGGTSLRRCIVCGRRRQRAPEKRCGKEAKTPPGCPQIGPLKALRHRTFRAAERREEWNYFQRPEIGFDLRTLLP